MSNPCTVHVEKRRKKTCCHGSKSSGVVNVIMTIIPHGCSFGCLPVWMVFKWKKAAGRENLTLTVSVANIRVSSTHSSNKPGINKWISSLFVCLVLHQLHGNFPSRKVHFFFSVSQSKQPYEEAKHNDSSFQAITEIISLAEWVYFYFSAWVEASSHRFGSLWLTLPIRLHQQSSTMQCCSAEENPAEEYGHAWGIIALNIQIHTFVSIPIKTWKKKSNAGCY